MTSENSYRNIHTDFVSNQNGSNPYDVVFASLPTSFLIPLSSLILPFLYPLRYAAMKYSSQVAFHITVEIITIAIPVLLSITVLADNPFINCMCILAVTMTLCISTPSFWKSGTRAVRWSELFHYPLAEKRPHFLTNCRSAMLFITALAILAVDFQVFPRRFIKTETFGYSLMDVGVGTFLCAQGAGSRIRQSREQWSKIYPIFILAFLRLFAVKMCGYHEHFSEYGVHWNFFFTLGSIKAFSAIFKIQTRPGIIAISVLAIYEISLKLGLQDWILSDHPREGLLYSNREGIFSMFGYIALYYTAMELGDCLKKPRTLFKDWFWFLIGLCTLTTVGWMAIPAVEALFGEPSRRLVNTTYCIWMMTFNLIQLCCYLAFDLLLVTVDYRRKRISNSEPATDMKPILREPYLMQFINRHALFFFLLANVLTGVVNMIFDTVHMNVYGSMCILVGYCCTLSLFVTYLSARGTFH